MPLLLALLTFQAPEPSPLDRLAAAMAGHRAVAFTVVGGIKDHPDVIRVRFLAPGMFDVVNPRSETHCDGVHAWRVDNLDRSWYLTDAADSVREMAWLPGFGAIFPNAPKPVAAGDAKPVTLDGKSLLEIQIANPPRTPDGYTTFIRIDPATNLLAGLRSEREGKPYEDDVVRDIEIDPPLTPADFRYNPPKDYRAPASPAPTKLPQVPVVSVRPGAWSAGGYPPVLISPTIRQVGEFWTVDLQTKTANAYAWPRAITVTKDGRHAVLRLPRGTATKPPKFVHIRTATQEPTPRSVMLDVQWPQG